jgi:hypothetical protein
MGIGLQCLFVAIIGFFVYYLVLPVFLVVAYPRVYVFNPERDVLYYNGRPACRISSIRDFYGHYRSAGRSSYGEWGVTMADGTYYRLDGGFLVGSDVEQLAAYLNNYLKKHSGK